ncbi:MAG: DeoR family transcriptional regulator [Firmicutes bacterium HGW-Firmicutes-5]|nr:MAG: DeoR family transcriptional regulator [Firmicutes bacterium HGW-Firmicutes-5]
MTFLNDRQIAILNLVSEKKKINVASLSEKLSVSQVTIRQDLKMLEADGMLKRYHGGAMPVSNDDMLRRLSVNFETKSQIAKMAASLVKNGETVLIESGSTNALLAAELGKKSGITIVTNSAFISRFVRDLSNVKIILLGGEYQHESEVLVGPLTRLCVKEFHVDKVFIGVDGFSQSTGFTCTNLFRAEVAKSMAQQAQQIIIVTDSTKFNEVGVASQFRPHEVDIVITDSKIAPEDQGFLENANVKVITV